MQSDYVVTKRVTPIVDTEKERLSFCLALGQTEPKVIKRIELVNFMSHERTVIEPADGLTVLVGPNNCGKSAFVAALQILCHNAKSSYVLRHGAKLCEIAVETDDGHIVTWSRKKSGSPKYVINGEEFDRLRGGVPEELHAILGLDKVACEKDEFDIHFGEQKSPIFLLDDSGKAAAQFFASSSDAIRLVEMQDRHKSKVRDSKRDQTRLTSEKQLLEDDLESLEPIDELEEQLVQLESQYNQIQKSVEKVEHLQILIKALQESERSLERHSDNWEVLTALPEPPVLGDVVGLESLLAKQIKVSTAHAWALGSAKVLKQLNTPPKIEDENWLGQTIDNLIHSTHEFDWSSESSVALESLESPPKLGDHCELEGHIFEQRSAICNLESCSSRFKYLSKLAPPPELVEESELESLLGRISKGRSQLDKSAGELEAIKEKFSTLNFEIQTWVEENPSCPTCGSETRIEQLIGSSAGRKCHG